MEKSTRKTAHLPKARTIALIGAGAAAGLGTYLYHRPALRKKMRAAGSVKKAAGMIGQEIRHDSAEAADLMMTGMADSIANGLRGVRGTLGSRFARKNSAAAKKAHAQLAA